MKKRLRDALSGVLPASELGFVYNSYDIVGDIAIVRLSKESEKWCKDIANAIMTIHRNVRTVVAQTSPVHGSFRIRDLKHIRGENRTVTTHFESGCMFAVDVGKCYFSPRLSYERIRVAKQVRTREIVVNMFAGVGCFSILIAKNSITSKVYSIDVNPAAVQLMRENARLNRVYEQVVPILGDSKDVIRERLSHAADRVLMPLPEKAFEYLPFALLALREAGGIIHYYDFEHAKKDENPIEKVKLRVTEELESLKVSFRFDFSHVVRHVGPNWYQVVLDIGIA